MNMYTCEKFVDCDVYEQQQQSNIAFVLPVITTYSACISIINHVLEVHS